MLCLNSELVGERLALPLSESGSLDLDLSTSRSTQPTDEGDVIDKMLFKCKANLCQHPLTIDQVRTSKTVNLQKKRLNIGSRLISKGKRKELILVGLKVFIDYM